MSDGYAMTGKDIGLYLTIIRLYEQQQYMYDNRIHSVEHRIVSISQPWLRPIVRGKVKAPVEFGAKFDLSLDSEGYGRLEKISFEAYNESTCLIEAIERFKERTGYYPERVLADQIYRTRENRSYCKVSITLKFCTFFTLKKCTDITVFSLRVIHLFPLVDNFHQQSLLLWNDEGFYQVLPLIWYYLGICPAILRSFCLL